MNWSSIKGGDLLHFIQCLMSGLGMLADEVVLRCKEEWFLGELIDMLTKGKGYRIWETPSQRKARDIVGVRFIGPREMSRFFGYEFTYKELAALEDVPFKNETLERVFSGEGSNNTILFPLIPVSAYVSRSKVLNKLMAVDNQWQTQGLYEHQNFTGVPVGGVRWVLMTLHKDPNRHVHEDRKDQLWSPSIAVLVQAVAAIHLMSGREDFPVLMTSGSCIDRDNHFALRLDEQNGSELYRLDGVTNTIAIDLAAYAIEPDGVCR